MKRFLLTLGLLAAASTAMAAGSDTITLHDPFGLYVTLISVVVVLVALIVLWLLIDRFGKLMTRSARKKANGTPARNQATAKAALSEADNGEIVAAIALALILDQEERHDRESEVITFNKVARVYSPWSSKIHGLTHEPTRR